MEITGNVLYCRAIFLADTSCVSDGVLLPFEHSTFLSGLTEAISSSVDFSPKEITVFSRECERFEGRKNRSGWKGH